jgi:SAM-dependent methyltransferase
MSALLDPTAVALARLYDVDLLDDPGDLDLYLAMAERADGPILELGVGSGRLAVPLAGAGWPVTGVDRDPAMLARARVRAETADHEAGKNAGRRLQLVEADMLDLRLAGPVARFRLGFIGLNSLLLLGDRAAQAAAVRTLARYLAPGGIALVDIWLPDADDLARYDGRLILEYTRTDPETGRTVVKTGSAIHDAATQAVELTTIFDEGLPGEAPIRWVRRDRLRLVGADELRGFAEAAGLEVEILAGGYDLEPLGPGSDRTVLVAIRR